MTYTLPLHAVRLEDRPAVGGKAYTLSLLARHGVTVPEGLVVTVDAYRTFVSTSGLSERIAMELGRKRFEDMRWEEIWDAALRIRNLFQTAPMPAPMEDALVQALESRLGARALVVRSSAPGEDSRGSSFAGLHESYVNVRGTRAVIAAVRKVWASLWSDAALLYRKELALEVESSAMAVLIQEIVTGERSGVMFCQNPNDPDQAVLEAVHGLNEGLVDGRVEPDRWILDRRRRLILSHTAPVRDVTVLPGPDGTRLQSLPADLRDRSPLADAEVGRVFETALRAETLLEGPQDVEWTFRGDSLHLLQARPITTLGEAGEDPRPWYLSLRRSFDNLKDLRRRIEEEILSGMASAADLMDQVDPAALSDEDLASEILRRQAVLEEWTAVYWDECIPFAHGVRLFGHVYNDTVHPEDPFEFVALLGSRDMLSVGRNRALQDLAAMVRENRELRSALRRGERTDIDPAFELALDRYLHRYGALSCHDASCTRDEEDVIALVLKLAALAPEPDSREAIEDRAVLEERFLSAYGDDRRDEALEILDLARASYRLRDDDNLYLGRIEGRVLEAANEGKARLRARLGDGVYRLTAPEVATGLTDPSFQIPASTEEEGDTTGYAVEARQLVGQPAGPGLASGRARVILETRDLRALEAGEVLVCDAVDPNMTTVVPLAAGIVERRGGMLIHGAIIAREYGLPCVTGVPEATVRIRTGDSITVDGYLGIVTVDRQEGVG
jgi:pyruvate,water dikinase